MTDRSATPLDYLVLDDPRRAFDDRGGGAGSRARRRLERAGWRTAIERDGLSIHLGPRSRLRAVQVHRAHFLIGRFIPAAGCALSALIGQSRSDLGLARAVVSHGWGRYVLVWRGEDGELRLLRDPSGALDCLWWPISGMTAAAGAPPPEGLGLDPAQAVRWSEVAAVAKAPGRAASSQLLTGYREAPPGFIVGPSLKTGEAVQVWRPADFVRRRCWDDDPEHLVSMLGDVVATLAEDHEILLSELSGGLDSAVLAACLKAREDSDRARFVNFYDARAREGDERVYATACAAHLGLRLESRAKARGTIELAALET